MEAAEEKCEDQREVHSQARYERRRYCTPEEEPPTCEGDLPFQEFTCESESGTCPDTLFTDIAFDEGDAIDHCDWLCEGEVKWAICEHDDERDLCEDSEDSGSDTCALPSDRGSTGGSFSDDLTKSWMQVHGESKVPIEGELGFTTTYCDDELCYLTVDSPLFSCEQFALMSFCTTQPYSVEGEEITSSSLTINTGSLGSYDSINDSLIFPEGKLAAEATWAPDGGTASGVNDQPAVFMLDRTNPPIIRLPSTTFAFGDKKVDVRLEGTLLVPDMTSFVPDVVPSSPRPQEPLTIKTTVWNLGTGKSGNTRLRAYLSDDMYFDRGIDPQIGSAVPVGGLSPVHGSPVLSISAIVPAEVGPFWIFTCVEEVFLELDTMNQCSPTGVKIEVAAPDLRVISPSVIPHWLRYGQEYTFTATVENAGTASSTPSTLRYYISKDEIISTSDEPIDADGDFIGETDSVSGLDPTEMASFALHAPAPQESGTFWIGACVDVDTLGGEIETGNQCSEGVPIKVVQPFVCTGEALVVQDTLAQLYQVDQATSPFEQVAIGGTAGIEANNLGFRRSDGLLWGIELKPNGNDRIIQVDATGTVFYSAHPVDLPPDVRFSGGDLSGDGSQLYLTAYNQSLYILDLPPPMEAVPTEITWSVRSIPEAGAVQDWAYNPIDGLLYGGDHYDGELARLDPVSGARDDFAVAALPGLPDLPHATSFGGSWFEATGHLFLYQNSGSIFEIDLGDLEDPTPTVVAVQDGPGSGRNDATACMQDILGAAKQMTVSSDGVTELVTIEYVFENLSVDQDLFELTAKDNLGEVFGADGVDWRFVSIASVPLAFANPGFDGADLDRIELINEDQILEAGEEARVTVEIELLSHDARRPDGYYCNQVLVVGQAADGTLFGDLSTRGLAPDPNGDNVAVERDLTCVSVGKDPFECATEALFINGSGGSLKLWEVGSDNSFTRVPIEPIDPVILSREINNIGFRGEDGLLYGVDLTDSGDVRIVQIDSAGRLFDLGRPPRLPADFQYNAGDLSPDGDTMVLSAHGKPLYQLSLAAVPKLPPVSTLDIYGNVGYVFDWAAHPSEGLLYGGDSTHGEIATLDPETGERIDFGVEGLESSIEVFGSSWFDGSGRLVLLRNDGHLTRIDLVDREVVEQIPDAPASDGAVDNDGAACSSWIPCTYSADCGSGNFCLKDNGDCLGQGVCKPRPRLGECIDNQVVVCGCDTILWNSQCQAHSFGVNIADPDWCEP